MTLWFYHFYFTRPTLFFLFAFHLVQTEKSPKENSTAAESETKPKKTSESEFISDRFNATDERDLVEIRENMTKLGMASTNQVPAPTGKEVTWFWGIFQRWTNLIIEFYVLFSVFLFIYGFLCETFPHVLIISP